MRRANTDANVFDDAAEQLLENSSVDQRQLDSVNSTLYTDGCLDKNTLELNFARFNMYDIYTMYKNLGLHLDRRLNWRKHQAKTTWNSIEQNVPDTRQQIATVDRK